MPRSRHQIDPELLSTTELSDDRPKGVQLRKVLEQLADRSGPGALMPSERVLADQFRVSRTTVRQEIERMVGDGVLFRRHGLGTVVAAPRPAHTDLLTSFSRDMRARGLTPGSRVLSATAVPADPDVAAQLEVEPGSLVLHLVRLRLADDVPMALERTNVSLDRFPGLDALHWSERSLFDTLEERWSVRPATSDAHIAAALPDPDEAGLLGIDARQPCLQIASVTRDVAGTVIEADRSLYRGDRYEVHTRARRTHP
ncbi:MAG TPA: GntR family transcriptional regulator [Actinopolymorphaceae bacterium]